MVTVNPRSQVKYICDTEAERDAVAWTDGASAFCKDTEKLYVLKNGAWKLIGPSSGGSDPWTYIVLPSDFSTTSATAVDITGLAFTPLLNTKYEFEAVLMVRAATATVNPRPGLAWPTGMTDGVASLWMAQSSAAQLQAFGNIAAAILLAVGGIPNTTQSWPAGASGMVIAGATPSGAVKLQLASETAGTSVTVKAGSFLKYRTIA